ncbi:mycothiol synthase [Psychromicrobium xiongbiense]|uniref:mycothiol synthase n=1 Tax=Psychromicrobium xiongbiense TaxID=3051184 RepID=UPI0025576CB2|nr:mycothiol synthase [Psychromicrobium sp. YIM S02556]
MSMMWDGGPVIQGGTSAQLAALARAARESDGQPPFSEQTLLDIARGDQSAVLFHAALDAPARPETTDDTATTADAPAAFSGAAVVLRPASGSSDHSKNPQPATLELTVHPAHRGRGLGDALIQTVLGWLAAERTDSDSGPSVLAWAHGDHPAARALAARYGFAPVRELLQLSLESFSSESSDPMAQTPPTGLPAGFSLRTFQPGDEDAVLRVNAQAFTHHPEQGSLSLVDLQDRMAQPWFDPQGLFLVFGPDQHLRGFHWTKLEASPSGTAEGEVYVVGIDPQAQGLGLGRALTQAGLDYLRSKRPARIVLYVDADNTAAVRLYHSLGFTLRHTDVMYHLQA